MARNKLAGIAPVNVERLAIWAYDETTGKYGEPIDLSDRLMSYKDSLSKNSSDLRGAGLIIETAYGTAKGNLELALAVDLIDDMRSKILGETFENGVNLTTVNDVVPNVVVALQSRGAGKTVNLRKWLNVTLTEGEDAAQQREDTPQYSTPTLSGTYIPDENGNLRARYDKIDPVANKAIVNKWFTDADFIGEEQTEQTKDNNDVTK